MNTFTSSALERTWIHLKKRVRNVWKRRKCRPSEATYLLQDKYTASCTRNDVKYVKYCKLIDEDAVDASNARENASKCKQKVPTSYQKRFKRALLNSCRYIGQGGATVGTVTVIPSYDCNCDLTAAFTMRASYSLNVPSFCIHDTVYSTNYYC